MRLLQHDPSVAELPDWLSAMIPFNRRVVEANGYRIHLIDHGRGRPVLMVHGNPTWSFLWRKVIGELSGEFRCVAPDLFGLGLSEKPRSISAHSLQAHIETIVAVVEALDLRDIIIAGQDWGGPVATGVASRLPDRVTGAVLGNTAVLTPSRFLTTPFHRFARMPVVSDLAFRVLNFPVPVLGRTQGDPKSISGDVQRAYAWPLRHFRDRTAPLALARMVPGSPDHPTLGPLAQCDAWVRGFKGPKALVWGMRDPILGKALRRIKEAWPDAPVTETQAGHFLQEEVPAEIATAIRGVATVNR